MFPALRKLKTLKSEDGEITEDTAVTYGPPIRRLMGDFEVTVNAAAMDAIAVTDDAAAMEDAVECRYRRWCCNTGNML